ncbi:MAG: prepilin peptidase [Caulobacterales bacterium]
MSSTVALAAIGAIAGAVFGAFAATVAVRASSGETALFGQSRCDACAKPLAAHETVPVVSFLLHFGRCRACGAAIPRLHIVGEFGGAVLGAGVLGTQAWPNVVWIAGLVASVWTLCLMDWSVHRLPDPLVALTGLFAALLAVRAGTLMLNAAIAGVFVVAVWAALRILEHRRGRMLMGRGDLKLMAALGVGLGPALPSAVGVAACGALAVALVGGRAARTEPRAFGPWLALGALVAEVGT